MSIVRPLPENDKRAALTETLEGYVVDCACVRKYPRAELLDRARRHTLSCLRMGHCVESGYALIDDSDRLSLLDPAATPLLLDVIRGTRARKGIKLRALREMNDGEMETQRLLFVTAERSKAKRRETYMEDRVPPYAG